MEKEYEKIRQRLLNDNMNFALVMKMTNDELLKADNISDYEDYENYMNYLSHKYDI